MIRIYTEEEFSVGKSVEISSDEMHYFKTVRRAQGRIVLFNRKGQQAEAEFQDPFFVIRALQNTDIRIWPVHVAVGLPERSVCKDLVAQLSELGVERLSFFPAARSQSAGKRREIVSKLERAAIESARQCARPRPLELGWLSWEELLKSEQVHRIFLDEAGSQGAISEFSAQASILVVVGCEGGWTDEERQKLLSGGFKAMHFSTAILKVATAAVLGGFSSIQALSRGPASQV